MESIIEKLTMLVEMGKNNHIPKDGYSWASGALRTTRSILKTIESMEAHGKRATYNQRMALRNMEKAADRWLNNYKTIAVTYKKKLENKLQIKENLKNKEFELNGEYYVFTGKSWYNKQDFLNPTYSIKNALEKKLEKYLENELAQIN